MQLDASDLLPVREDGILGDLRMWPDLELPHLDRRSKVYVWLPPDYDGSSDRYPVLYLHDGHNMFLPRASFAGEVWHVDRAMTRLAAEGIEVVVVAVPCHPELRGEEYTRYAHPEHGGGRAADYGRFLLDELKPAVDDVLRTRPGPEHTVVAGSSLGAVVSADLWASRPDVVGGAGLFSPAFWWPGEQALADVEDAAVTRAVTVPGRVYLDVGGQEEPDDPEIQQRYVLDAERLLGSLRRAGVPVRYVYDSGARHVEAAWAERVGPAIAWLLRGSVTAV
ncbi:alpha/beta hydrolase [Serinicoccus marinus]|uniref:alpha/beta hydrolase n=1 Tax=Serinicoccus marinus TaxID=247333 RepID=UPI0003B5A16D|nr:alpha/beta hydrolase-fold protein [Serinicoccus marinus]